MSICVKKKIRPNFICATCITIHNDFPSMCHFKCHQIICKEMKMTNSSGNNTFEKKLLELCSSAWLWGSILGSFPYFASYFPPGVISTPIGLFPLGFLILHLCLHPKPLFWALILHPTATWTFHQDVTRPSASMYIRLAPPIFPAQGSSSRAPWVWEWCHLS